MAIATGCEGVIQPTVLFMFSGVVAWQKQGTSGALGNEQIP